MRMHHGEAQGRPAQATALYQRARQHGCDHPHAIRILARAWLRVLWRAWQDRTHYSPSTHAAPQPTLRPSIA